MVGCQRPNVERATVVELALLGPTQEVVLVVLARTEANLVSEAQLALSLRASRGSRAGDEALALTCGWCSVFSVLGVLCARLALRV